MAAEPESEPETDARASDDARELAAAGTELAGALVGATVGLIGGPLGAYGGAVMGVAATRAAKVVAGRLWGREAERAGAALTLIGLDAEARRDRGEVPRDDGFFEGPGDGLRPDGEELLEGLLREAASAYEERKVPLLARLYSATAHDASVPAADALFLVRLAGELTYRQFEALGVIANHEDHFDALVRARAALDEVGSSTVAPDPAVLLELDDLGDRRLVGLEADDRVLAAGEGVGNMGALSTAKWGAMRLTTAGELLVRLTGAGEVPRGQRDAWIKGLGQPDW